MEIEDVVRKITDALVRSSLRLKALEREIRTAQPVADGAVLLELHYHKPTCLGCPHVRWKQWKGHPHHLKRRWQAHAISNPLQRLPHRDESDDLRPLIREALKVERYRSQFIHGLSALSKACRMQELHG